MACSGKSNKVATSSDAPKWERRGAKAKDFVFTEEQCEYLDKLIHEFEAEVERVNPKLKAHNAALTKWKTETSITTMQLDLFKSNPTPSLPLKLWEAAIRRKFTNYYNNTLKGRLLGNKVQKLGKSSNSVSGGPFQVFSKPVNNILARATVIITSEFPAWELFASENEEALQVKMDDIHACHPDLVGGALHNKVLKKLWKKADQGEWKEKAAVMAADINTNQNEFPDLMAQAVQNLIARGRLGSVVTSLNYAYRDSHGGVIYGIVYNGYNTTTEERIDWKYEDHGAKVMSWKTVAEPLLPCPPAERIRSLIPVNDARHPIFPKFDLMSATEQQIINAMQDYLNTSWEYAAQGGATIPWGDLASNPGKYYDLAKFKLPIPLKDLTTGLSGSTPSNPAEMTEIEQPLSKTSEGHPVTTLMDSMPSISQPPVHSRSPDLHTPSALAKIIIEHSVHDAAAPTSDTISSVSLITPNSALSTTTAPLSRGNTTPCSNGSKSNKAKKGRKQSGKKSETQGSSPGESCQVKAKWKSSRHGQKCKEPETVMPESTRPAKKKKHGWIETDDHGNYWNERGEPCDKHGHPL
ncbi:hypothetical protein BDZ97DRAFT_1923822 [Flammula alnicola]|nr:hypothetical protein BDZ97DRAFT_1923822 [Flammula alnicola]